jgi:caudovirus prohead protease|nr:MAG TPA: prohead serine protease [Caudoviricetes sp.]
MSRFILSDEATTNSYGFRIKTDGINLERFKANPVMLDGHAVNNTSVIGRWTDIRKENGQLTAETDFDSEDSNAQTIKGKVERGYIKGASVGLSFSKKDLKHTPEGIILEKCELYEASIVAIPSNATALRLTMDGDPITQKEMQTLCLSLTNEFKNDLNNRKMTLQLSTAALIVLGLTEKKELAQTDLEAAILSLGNENKDLKEKLTLSEEKVNAFVEKEKTQRAALATELIETAIKQGKITADKKESFQKLAAQDYQLAKATLDAIPAKKNFTAGVNVPQGTSAITTMEDFQKLSLEEQLAFKQADPEGYKSILPKSK